MLLFVFSLCLAGVFGAEYTLPGECPNVKLQENLDPTKFSGLWYTVASYASDGREINDCSTVEFQEDNLGYMYKETYVEVDQGNRTQKMYQARVDPTFDAGKDAVFVLSHGDGDKVLQFPFFILATDYDGYAIAYTCRWLKEKIRMHYVFAWVLTRSKDKLEGELLQKVEDKLSKYTDLAEHRSSFVFKDFTDASCAYTNKLETDFFTNNFW
ncbi:hypothetical protein PYW07_007708 [Mythimna separata]|uniref:Lipocalin/cytosolic fatty-acid binding domain-containing protein n=1 Tax=Mythimna separata TaxID=271217 RepID=A0AAD7YQX0_MYTSE|nr:hypothetical protein PYW07_007708 [Mythimna separata]